MLSLAISAQTDTTVAVKSKTIDYLFRQNVLCNKYKSDNTSLLAEKSALELVVVQNKSIISRLNDNIDKMQENSETDLLYITSLKDQLKTANRRNGVLKVGCISIGVLGACSTLWFVFH